MLNRISASCEFYSLSILPSDFARQGGAYLTKTLVNILANSGFLLKTSRPFLHTVVRAPF
jgi:hypothetical protein